MNHQRDSKNNESGPGSNLPPAFRFRDGFGTVWWLARPHLRVLIVAIAGSAVFAAGITLGAKALGWVIDQVVVAAFAEHSDTTSGDTDRKAVSVWVGAGLIMTMAGIRSIGVIVRRFFAGMVSERAERQLRLSMARQYVDQPMAWLRAQPTGDLIAHVDSDVTRIVDPLHPLPFSVAVVFLTIFTAISLFLIDPLMAAVALVMFPVVLRANAAYSRRVEAPMTAIQDQVGVLAGTAAESFEGAQIIKTLGRHQAEVDRFDSQADDLRRYRLDVQIMRIFLDTLLETLPSLTTVAVVLVGAQRIRAGSISPGELVEIATLLAAVAFPLLVIGFFLESLPQSVVARRRVDPVLTADLPDRLSRRTRESPRPVALTVDKVGFAWPETPGVAALADIDLTVEPGEMVAIVGPTGSGKSTLCRAIGGLLSEYPGLSGTIQVDGQAIESFHPADRIETLALVFQQAFLFADTIAANIGFADPTDPAMVRAARAASIHDWITDLDAGYETLLGERGVTVSGGQRQRIALARALARPSGLLILDDATSAVDTVIETRILDGLRRPGGPTLLVVANRLATITLADRIVYMVEGRVVAQGTHDSLLERDDYRSLVSAYELATTEAEVSGDG